MDAFTGLLQGPKARGAFLLRSVLDPPWSLRIVDQAPICVVTMLHGAAWILPDAGASVLLRPGDVAVIHSATAYTIADSPDTPVQVVVGAQPPAGARETLDVTELTALGVHTWGGDRQADSSVMLSGTYLAPGEIGRRLLDALPSLLVRPAGEAGNTLVGLLGAEIDRVGPGQALVLDRLLDLLLIDVVRSWLTAADAGAPAWGRAQFDPLIGPVLRLIHERPAHPWTVDSLAADVGVSRALLARRFTEVVGEPPMTYLTGWRLTLAADLLREPDATVASVARAVGYGGAFAFSAAFKRVRGVSPQEHRSGVASANARGSAEATGTGPGTVVLIP